MGTLVSFLRWLQDCLRTALTFVASVPGLITGALAGAAAAVGTAFSPYSTYFASANQYLTAGIHAAREFVGGLSPLTYKLLYGFAVDNLIDCLLLVLGTTIGATLAIFTVLFVSVFALVPALLVTKAICKAIQVTTGGIADP